MFVLPSFTVEFRTGPGAAWNWRVVTEEGLEAFCKVLRLNGVTAYSVTQEYPAPDVVPKEYDDDALGIRAPNEQGVGGG